MEDYKQKYENALEWARNLYNSKHADINLRLTLEDVFPELEESEDEKIMKDLIGYFKVCGNTTFAHHRVSDILSYLENLGTSTEGADSLSWNELSWEDINTLEDLMAKVHYEFRNGIGAESFGKEVLERFREIKGDEYMDSCEQNPAWSEEDEEMIKGLNNCLSELEEKNGWRYVYINNKDVEINKIRNWLKSLKERMKGE